MLPASFTHKMLLAFAVFIGTASFPEDAAAQAPPATLAAMTATELRAIVADATPDGKLHSSVRGYPLFQSEKAYVKIKRKGEREFVAMRFSSKASRERFVVLEREETMGPKRRFVDVITYDAKADVYRRWQLIPDDTVIGMVGLKQSSGWNHIFGDPKTTVMGTTISWSGVPAQMPSNVKSIGGIENFSNGPRADQKKIHWNSHHVVKDTIVYREEFTFRGSADGPPVSMQRPPAEWQPKLNRKSSALARNNRSEASRLLDQLIADVRGKSSRPRRSAVLDTAWARQSTIEHYFNDLNFSVRIPSKDTVVVPTEELGPDVVLALYRGEPFRTDMLVVHDLPLNKERGVAYTAEVLRRTVAMDSPEMKVSPVEEYGANGTLFRRFVSLSRGDREFSRCETMAIHQGRFYNMVTTIAGIDEPGVRAAAEAVMTGFLLKQPVESDDTKLAGYDAPEFGVQVTFTEEQPREWRDAGRPPAASRYTVAFPNTGHLFVIPVDLGPEPVDEQILVNGLMSCVWPWSERAPDAIRANERWTQGTAKGRRLVLQTAHDGVLQSTTELRILQNGNIGLLIAAGIRLVGPVTEEMLQRRLDAFVFQAPVAAKDDGKRSRANHEVLNAIGSAFYHKQRYQEAGRFFQRATEAAPRETRYKQNYERARQRASQ